jgi:hypothetical protein
MESELISKHPNTFSGEDDIPGSFLSEEITEETPSSKMKVSELKAKIKEDILSILSEQDEEEDVEVEDEIEDEVEVDTEEPCFRCCRWWKRRSFIKTKKKSKIA